MGGMPQMGGMGQQPQSGLNQFGGPQQQQQQQQQNNPFL